MQAARGRKPDARGLHFPAGGLRPLGYLLGILSAWADGAGQLRLIPSHTLSNTAAVPAEVRSLALTQMDTVGFLMG